ncbi:MAG TPA: hypothetical protein VMY18_12805 [Acidobacteriota bacterium]|nr:hypothetical protein [Acidobacteriota bacterium]
MPKASLVWKLRGGYSRFVEAAEVSLRLETGPTKQQLNATPWGLFRREKPLELVFIAKRSLRGEFLPGLRWKLGPEGRIRALLLQPGNAFLGNYRVPKEHFAVQWSVDVLMNGEGSLGPADLLFRVDGGSQMSQSWVALFKRGESIGDSLLEAWKLCPSPFEPESVWAMPEGQVVHWTWIGKVRFSLDLSWSVVRGWGIGTPEKILQATAALNLGAKASADLQVSKSGRFAIRLSRRRNQVKYSLLEERGVLCQTSFEAKVTFKDRVAVKASKRLVRPLLEPLDRRLEQALAKRIEMALVLDYERWKHVKSLLQAEWKSPARQNFLADYQLLLEGGHVRPRKGIKVRSRLEKIEGRRFNVMLNFLDRLHLGQATEQRKGHVVEIDPLGNVLIEESVTREKRGHKWSEIQLLKLIWHVIEGEIQEEDLLWVRGREGEMNRNQLAEFLRLALRTRSIPQFVLPAAKQFPRRIRATWATAFTLAGLEKVIRADASRRWEALVQAFLFSEPERYGKKTFWRDWIDYREVRRCFDADPVQGHLASRYPLAGRTREERMMVSSAYRSAKSFLRIAEAWEAGNKAQLLELVGNRFNVPAFLYLHLLCPPKHRESAVVLTGDFEAVWGSEELAERL